MIMKTETASKDINRGKILFMGMLIYIVGGISYSWGLVQPYIIDYYSVDTSFASIPFSINLGIFVVGNLIGGKMQQILPTQKALYIGIFMKCFGIFASGFIPAGAPWLLIVTYGVIVGIGAGVVYNTLLTAMQKYFPDKKGMATGFILCMMGVSGFYLSPIINYILINYSLRAMFAVLGILAFVAGMIGAYFVKDPPAGYMPPKQASRRQITIDKSLQYEPRQMLKTKQYYYITLSMMLAVPGFMLINPQFILLSEERLITGAQALTAIMLASVFQAVGRLLVPFLSDKLGRVKILLIIFACSALSILGLTFVKGMLYPVLFIALAFFYGGIMGIYPSLSSDYFGLKHAGINYSFVLIGFGTASILCPFLVKAVKGTAMGPSLSFAIAAGAAIIGLVLVVLLRKYPHYETKPAHSAKTEKEM